MNFRHYEALHWIGRLGSFHAAARHLRTSQAAISVRIRDLERQLGVVLFERMHDGVRLTAKGYELLPYAAQLIALDSEVQRIGSATSLSGRVRFGATSIHAATWLPALLHQVSAETPDITIDLAIDTSEVLHVMMEQGRLDIAVLAVPALNTRLITEPVGPIANAWVASPGLGLTGSCAARDLARHPIISDRPGTRLHTAMLAWFRAEGVEPQRQHSASHLDTRLHLAEAGVGVALAARSAALRAARQGLVQVVATARAAPQLDYVLACTDATLPPAARHVADAARSMISQKPDLDAYFAVARQPMLGPPA